MNLNLKMTLHDDMYNVKYQQPNTLHELVLFEPINQIRVIHAMFNITGFMDCLTIAFNPSHTFIESDFSKVIDHVV